MDYSQTLLRSAVEEGLAKRDHAEVNPEARKRFFVLICPMSNFYSFSHMHKIILQVQNLFFYKLKIVMTLI